MTFDPTNFANLGDAYASASTDGVLTYSGDRQWFSEGGLQECPTTSGFGFELCREWAVVPDPDPVDLSEFAATAPDFVTVRIDAAEDGFVEGGSDPLCRDLSLGGGCGPDHDPFSSGMIWRRGGDHLSGCLDDGTPIGGGPWTVDGSSGTSAPKYLINPNPVTYFGMDATNTANAVLWRLEDILELHWEWFGDRRAGHVENTEAAIGVFLFHYTEPPFSPDPGQVMCVL